MIKSLVLPALVLVGCSFLHAEESVWSQSLSFGLNLARGNTESTQVSASYDGKRTFDDASLNLKANGAFGEENDTKNTDNYSLETKYRDVIVKHFF